MNRRRFLAATGVAVGLAGCMGDSPDDADSDADSSDTTTDQSETPDDENGTGGEQIAFNQGWQTDVAENINGSTYDVALHDGRLYVGNSDGLRALDTADGEKIWADEEWREFNEVHADEAGVTVCTDDLRVGTFDPETGQLLWSNRSPGTGPEFEEDELIPATAVTSDVLTVPHNGGPIELYDRQTGDLRKEISDEFWDHLFTGDGMVVVQGFETAAFDVASGDELWRVDSDIAEIYASTAGTLVGLDWNIGSDDEAIVGLDSDTGTDQFSIDVEAVSGTMSAVDGVATARLGAINEEQHVALIDVTAGQIEWRHSLGEPSVPISPIVTEEFVISESEERLQLRDLSDGTILDETEPQFVLPDGVATTDTFFECGSTVVAYETA